jgi:hypothetical protein
MDESIETFVPLTFRRRGVQRVAADERSVHDVTLRDAGGELGPVRLLKSFLHVRKAAAAGGPVDDITATLFISSCAFIPTGNDTPLAEHLKACIKHGSEAVYRTEMSITWDVRPIVND